MNKSGGTEGMDRPWGDEQGFNAYWWHCSCYHRERDALEVAAAEQKGKDKNEDQEKAPEAAVMQI